jgi:hypothetical protein
MKRQTETYSAHAGFLAVTLLISLAFLGCSIRVRGQPLPSASYMTEDPSDFASPEEANVSGDPIEPKLSRIDEIPSETRSSFERRRYGTADSEIKSRPLRE